MAVHSPAYTVVATGLQPVDLSKQKQSDAVHSPAYTVVATGLQPVDSHKQSDAVHSPAFTHKTMTKHEEQTVAYFRRNLPHWLVADNAYFVTMRLHGTLSKLVMEDLQEERNRLEAQGGNDFQKEIEACRRSQFRRIEQILDGVKWVDEGLCHREIGQMMMDNLDWLRSRGWTIYAFVLMSTHWHALLRSSNGRSAELISDLDKFKSYTGRQANALMGKTGRFWARDSFDHWVRSADSFDGLVRYIVNNPVKAGLVNAWHNWRWTMVDDVVMYVLRTNGIADR